MPWASSNSAYARGFRDGLRGILAIGRYDAYRPAACRHVGSLATDRVARYRDMEAFACDAAHARGRLTDEELPST